MDGCGIHWFKKMTRPDRNILYEILRFCAVGVLATCIHYGIYVVSKRWIGINAAFITGYLISFVCNYFLSARFTFRAKTSVGTGIGFAGSHLINLALQTLLLNIMLHLGLNDNIAPIPVYAISVPVNFILVRYVFKRLDFYSSTHSDSEHQGS